MTKLFDARPFIIAEIGSNHKSLHDCSHAIAMAKTHGANAVKFQLFDKEALYGFDPCPEQSLPGSIEPAWLPTLKAKADACGVEFMCTAFSPKFVDMVDPYVEVHKIASSDLCSPQLLKHVRSKGKPIILSTGASSKADVALAVQTIGTQDLVLMYCVSAYPAYQHNLFLMKTLKDLFNVPVGFSDHSRDVVYAPLSAVNHFGATVIEKHVNFSPHTDTPDAAHALSPFEFKLMTEYLREHRDHNNFNPMPEEKEMFLKHNRRLIAIADIRKGDAFRFGKNYGAYRSRINDDQGMVGFAWEEFEGKSASREIYRGQGIKLGDIA